MKLSVIVCTRNRAHIITECLDSIAAAFVYAAPIEAEIVVVDSGSTDNTATVLKAWAGTHTVPLQLLFEPRAGLARARNCALKAARGQLFVFTDDDCRLSKEYVRELLAHDAGDTGLVLRCGRVALGEPSDLPLTITQPTLKRWSRRDNSARHDNIGDSGIGCNMTMRRSLVDRVGIFDETLGAGTDINGGEDTDYLFRAYLAGVTIETVPDMTIIHYHGRKTVAEGYQLLRGYMIGSGALYAKYAFKYPNLCRPFYWDCENAVKEIITGTNTFLPNIGFSHKNKLAYNVQGAIRYLFRKARA